MEETNNQQLTTNNYTVGVLGAGGGWREWGGGAGGCVRGRGCVGVCEGV